MSAKTEAFNLRNWRLDHNLTQREVAQYLGVPANTVARWERGELNIEHAQWLHLCLEHYDCRA